ncbi:MAG: lysophospholipase L1-like esterase [Planctomycetota bacterium]|jgi:lysophospholipase L1-like esterase
MARLAQKLALALASTALGLGVIELVVASWMPQPGAPIESKLGDWGNNVHQASEVPGLLYELKPGAESKYRPRNQKGGKIPVKINSYGMHGPEFEFEKRKFRRVAILGDSTTFGYGVQSGQSYSSILQTMLNNRDKPTQYQTMNFGVAGYSTKEEAIVLEHKALKFKPDAIVLGYNLNDPDGEHAGEPLYNNFAKPKWWRHSHITRYIERTMREYRIEKYAQGNLIRYWHTPGKSNWAMVEDGFVRIAELAQEAGLPVLVVLFTAGSPTNDPSTYGLRDLHAQVAAEARKNGFEVLDLSIAYSRLFKEGKKTQLPHMHPNLLGQRTAADEIAKFLLGEKGAFAQGQRAQ